LADRGGRHAAVMLCAFALFAATLRLIRRYRIFTSNVPVAWPHRVVDRETKPPEERHHRMSERSRVVVPSRAVERQSHVTIASLTRSIAYTRSRRSTSAPVLVTIPIPSCPCRVRDDQGGDGVYARTPGSHATARRLGRRLDGPRGRKSLSRLPSWLDAASGIRRLLAHGHLLRIVFGRLISSPSAADSIAQYLRQRWSAPYGAPQVEITRLKQSPTQPIMLQPQ
jgi:hypothetical protein